MLQELVKYMVKDLVMIVPNNSKNPKIHEYKVSKIRVKNKKYYISFDQYENEIILTEDQMVEFRIIVGHTFSSKEFHKIKNSEKMSLYYNKVLHYIDFKPRSKKEVYNYLLNLDVDEKSINEIIQKLIKIQYLDDERYAQSYILELIRKSKGRLYILQNLLNKGIDQELIQKYLNEYSFDEEKKNALKIVNKFISSIQKNPIKKQKMQITNKLLQEGYSFDIINYVLGEIEWTDNSNALLVKEYQKLLNKEIDQNKIIMKLLNKGFDYQDIKKIIHSCKYN